MTMLPNHRFRFTLKTLFGVVTIMALTTGLLVRTKIAADRQRRAAEAIWELEGSVEYDFDRHVSAFVRHAQPPPEWPKDPNPLSDWCGVDFFHDIVSVEISPFTAIEHEPIMMDRTTMEAIGELRGLWHLDIGCRAETHPQTFAPLRQMTRLRCVAL